MATSDRGLGSDNMSQADKDRIHAMGGKASGTDTTDTRATTNSKTTTNKSGGGRLSKDAQSKGGRNSHK